MRAAEGVALGVEDVEVCRTCSGPETSRENNRLHAKLLPLF